MAVYRERAKVGCLFHPGEPAEVVGDQYLADIGGAIVVICSEPFGCGHSSIR